MAAFPPTFALPRPATSDGPIDRPRTSSSRELPPQEIAAAPPAHRSVSGLIDQAAAAEAVVKQQTAENQARVQAALSAVGLAPNAVFRGARANAMFGDVAMEIELGAAVSAEPYAAAAPRARLGWPTAAGGAATALAPPLWCRGRCRVPETKVDEEVFVGCAMPSDETPAAEVFDLLIVTPGRPGDLCRPARYDRRARTVVGGGARWTSADKPEFSLAVVDALKS